MVRLPGQDDDANRLIGAQRLECLDNIAKQLIGDRFSFRRAIDDQSSDATVGVRFVFDSYVS
jgi:hypothetical protein